MSTTVNEMSWRQVHKPERKRLDSWKEVAAFFKRDERTVKRWEKSRLLPIHRIPGHQRSGVFAYTDELTDWLNSTQAEPEISDTLIAEPAFFDEPELKAPEAEPLEIEPAEAELSTHLLLPPSFIPSSRHWGAFVVACFVLLLTIGAFALHRFQLTHALHAQLSAPVHAASTPDHRAVEFYLMGRYYWNHRTGGSLNRALDAFTQAIVIDPSYAEAYAGLADTYNLLRQYSAMPESEAYPRAIAAANKALALNDSLAEAHRSLAFALFWWKWQIPEALEEYKKAIQLDPNDPETHHWFATSLYSLGRQNEALAEIERARELSPTSRSILADRALMLYSGGDHEASITALKEIEQTEQDFLSPPRYLSRLYFENGDDADFVNEEQRVALLSGNPEDAALASAAKQAWAHGGTRKMLEVMEAIQQTSFDDGQTSGYRLAGTCLRLGRKKEAIHYLQAALAARDANMFSLREGQFVDQLEGDPDFDRLREKVLQYLDRKAGQPLSLSHFVHQVSGNR